MPNITSGFLDWAGIWARRRALAGEIVAQLIQEAEAAIDRTAKLRTKVEA